MFLPNPLRIVLSYYYNLMAIKHFECLTIFFINKKMFGSRLKITLQVRIKKIIMYTIFISLHRVYCICIYIIFLCNIKIISGHYYYFFIQHYY